MIAPTDYGFDNSTNYCLKQLKGRWLRSDNIPILAIIIQLKVVAEAAQ